MSARILSGKEIAKEIRAELKQEIAELKEKHGIVPGLAVVLVGEDPASQVYVRNKVRTCEKLGVRSIEHRFPEDYPEAELLKLIDQMNEDDSIHGILVQLPLPKHIDEDKVLLRIRPDKDVDGFHPFNVGKMLIGNPDFLPCTPHGCQQILMRSGIETEGKDVVVVGRSNIVGKPVAAILVQKAKGANATVTICHTRTKNLAEHTRRADILIVAAGRPKAITADMVKEGAVVIDVGVNRIGKTPEGKDILAGDVDFEEVKEKASAITPVPGGVGPMTITMLMLNTVRAAKMRIK
ncbi:MAG: bifunctional methylenetetrahydrofolate dehydrogenase/methenyltetrahydrofolate cyclohydrolase FolD [Deltaproteobacteria bacterium]|nr:MAG: bifunctional methylenetetrahydrofolate dehydrogenase/methenyltetrahydrofolate cyclohydrolase FolD [Deltaproteobacteria bacterium]